VSFDRYILIIIVLIILVILVSPAAGTIKIDNPDRFVTQTDQDGPSYATSNQSENYSDEYVNMSLNIAAGVEVDSLKLQARHDMNVLRKQISNASSDSERIKITTEWINTIEDRYDSINQRKAFLMSSYKNNRISGGLFLSELISLQQNIFNQAEIRREVSTEESVTETLLNKEQLMSVNQPVLRQIEMAQNRLIYYWWGIHSAGYFA